MKVKKKVTRFLKDGNAFEVFLCVLLACATLVVFYVLINYLFPDGENYLKLSVSGIFSLGGVCISTIFAHKEKNKEAVLKYVTEKRLSWIEDTRKVTADLCAEVYRYVDIVPNINEINLLIKCNSLSDSNFNKYISEEERELNITPIRSKIFDILYGRLIKYNEQEDSKKAYYSFSNKYTLLYLRYNLNGERDGIILQVLRELYKSMRELDEKLTKVSLNELSYSNISELYDSKESIMVILRLLVQHTQIYLKLEWERIKYESIYDGNVKHRRKKIKNKMEKERLELYKGQLNFDANIKSRFALLMEPTYNRFKKQLVRRWIE